MSDDEGANEGGSGKVFLVLGLLLGGGLGAGGGYYYFQEPAKDGAEETEAVEKVVYEDLIPITFERIAVPIFTKRGNTRRYVGNYFIDLDVNVVGLDDQILVKRSQAQLQHAFISAVTKGDLMREDSSTELDVDKIAALLKAKAVEVVGADVVRSITVTKSMRVAN